MSLAANFQAESEHEIEAKTLSQDKLIDKITSSVIWAKTFKWEYWPFWVVYFPIFFYWTWISIRTRSFFFFTAANPGMEFGGLLGGSKYKILQRLPSQYVPKTYLHSFSVSKEDFLTRMNTEGLSFPIILKPEIGERGFLVELIKSEIDLCRYLKKTKVDFMVQEFVSYPIELGVFYYRYPDEEKGNVSSVVIKELMTVQGNGTNSVEELMRMDVRAKMHIKELRVKDKDLLVYRPKKGELVEVVSIGNHCRGTKFMSGNHIINDQLVDIFEKISRQVDGFYFGRYDLKCSSLEDLYEGRNIKIVELNGAGAEPAHIYHPGNSILNGYRDILFHLHVLKDISLRNHKLGVPYLGFWQGAKELNRIWKYARQKSA